MVCYSVHDVSLRANGLRDCLGQPATRLVFHIEDVVYYGETPRWLDSYVLHHGVNEVNPVDEGLRHDRLEPQADPRSARAELRT